jgi:ribosome biogenesis protein Nip4
MARAEFLVRKISESSQQSISKKLKGDLLENHLSFFSLNDRLYFAVSTSTFSIFGASARSSPAFAISAAAT